MPPHPPETFEPVSIPTKGMLPYTGMHQVPSASSLPVEGLILREISFGPVGQQVDAKFHFLLGVNPHGSLPWGNIGLEHSDMFSFSTCLIVWQPWERNNNKSNNSS